MNSSIAIVTKELDQVSTIKPNFNTRLYKPDSKSNMIETAGTCHPWHLVDTPIPKWMM
jgi:hypothetical protein